MENKLLLISLKKVLKSKKLSYGDVAKKLKLSEVSIKRIFSTFDCSLSRLIEICEMVDLTLIDLLEITKEGKQNENYFFSEAQENLFVKNPLLFAVFRKLYRKEDPRLVKNEFKLDSDSYFKILRSLEKLGLLDLYPNNQFKIKISGRLRLREEGVFFNKVLKKHNLKFLDYVYENVKQEDCAFQSSEVQMSKKSALAFVHELNELGRKYRSISFNEERMLQKKSLIEIKWLFALIPFTTEWQA